jgi:hypothetical protein
LRQEVAAEHTRLAHAPAAGLLALGLLGPPAPVNAEGENGFALLPEASLHLMAARYAPAETDFQWTSWVGGGVGLLRLREATLYGSANVETIIGNARRGFDANQANYHLELGVRRHFGGLGLAIVFHHVSRHAVDRPKVPAVDWNVLGFRASGRLPSGFPLPTRVEVGVGHTTLASLVGYRFEIAGGTDTRALTRGFGHVYLRTSARLVTTKRSNAFPRDGFLDLGAEGGVRFARGERALELFVAFERRNDVLLQVPASRDRALFGMRLGLEPRDAEAKRWCGGPVPEETASRRPSPAR